MNTPLVNGHVPSTHAPTALVHIMHPCTHASLPSTIFPSQTLSVCPTHALLITPVEALCVPCMHPCASHAGRTHSSSAPPCAPCLAHGVGWRPWSRSASSDTRRTSASCCSSKTAIATGRRGKDGMSGLDHRLTHRGFAISTSVILLGLVS